MIITDEARKLMLEVLEEDKKNVIKIEVVSRGCHGQLYLDTIISNDFELINEVPVQIDNTNKEYLNKIIFDVVNGNLTYRVEGESGCGGCSGCSDGCNGCDK